MLHSTSCVPAACSEDLDWKYRGSAKRDNARDVKVSSFTFNPNASAFVPRGEQQEGVQRCAGRRGNGELATVPQEVSFDTQNQCHAISLSNHGD